MKLCQGPIETFPQYWSIKSEYLLCPSNNYGSNFEIHRLQDLEKAKSPPVSP